MNDSVTQNGHAAIAAGSKSFALASRLLPPDIRNPVTQLYAWCRYCDDAIDGQILGHERLVPTRRDQERTLQALYQKTEAAIRGEPGADLIFQGLARLVNSQRIASNYPMELLQGFDMDVRQRVYQDEADLMEYCYHVAGVVGVMVSQIMGVEDTPTLDRACDLGIAFQLTNIARDVIDDAGAGRVYVPLSLLRRHNAPTAPVELAQPENWPQVHAAVLELLSLADEYYRSASLGVPQLPFRCAWAVHAALKVYQDIGRLLRQRGPAAWSQRISTGRARKVYLTAAAVPLGLPQASQPRSAELFCRPGR